MIVAMQPNASAAQIQHLCERIKEFGYTPHVIEGESTSQINRGLSSISMP